MSYLTELRKLDELLRLFDIRVRGLELREKKHSQDHEPRSPEDYECDASYREKEAAGEVPKGSD